MNNLSEKLSFAASLTKYPEHSGDRCADAGYAECRELQSAVVRLHEQQSFLSQTTGSSLVIGLIDHYCFSQECLTRALRGLNPADMIVPFVTVQACISADLIDVDLIIYYSHENGALLTTTQSSVGAIRRAYPLVPLVVLSDIDDGVEAEASRKMLASGANGFIPTRTGSIFTTVGAVRFMKDGGNLELFGQRPVPRRPGPSGVDRPSPLTAREMAVLALLQRGKANKIIAHELSMSENTVKIHVRNIMRKMDATNRTQAVDKARMLWGQSDSQALSGSAYPPPPWCRRKSSDRRSNPR